MYINISRNQFDRIYDRLNGNKDTGYLCYIGAINFAEQELKKGNKVTFCLGSNTFNMIMHAWIISNDKIMDTNRHIGWSNEDLIPTEEIELDPNVSIEQNFRKIRHLFEYVRKFGYE